MNLQVGEAIAFCDITCNECPAYIVTQMENQALLGQVLAHWQTGFFAFANQARLTLDGIKSAISERKGLG